MSNLDTFINQQTIEVEGVTYTFAEILMIDQTNINEAFSTQAARYAYFSALAAKAEALYNEAKIYRESVYAETELYYRDDFAKSNAKATEGLIRSCVVMDDKYLNAVDDENKALRNWKLIRALVDGLKQKGEMLISLSAMMRQEFEYNSSMNLLSTKERLKELR